MALRHAVQERADCVADQRHIMGAVDVACLLHENSPVIRCQ
jgi:hypothetical protein